jgi:DNA-binding SARP family transcriptional activator
MKRLCLLGGFAVHGPAGEPVTRLPQRRPEALLALLAVAADLGCTRDRIIALLWPEQDAAHARHNLRDALLAVRHALGPDVIISSGDSLRLNPADIRTDLEELLHLGAAASPADLTELYRGPFLDGFHLEGAPEFAQWLDAERVRLARMVGDVLERLAHDAETRGWQREAAARWARAVEHDPYNTRLVIHHVRALAAAGDRANALAVAETHARRLREELEIEAGPELAAEVAAIRSGRGTGP